MLKRQFSLSVKNYEPFCSKEFYLKLSPIYGEKDSTELLNLLKLSLLSSNSLELGSTMLNRDIFNNEIFQYNKEILRTRNSILKENTQEYQKTLIQLDNIQKDIRGNQSSSKEMIAQLKSQLRLDISKDREFQREMVNKYTHILHGIRNQADADSSEALKTTNTIKEATALRWSGVTYTAIACLVMYIRLVGS